MLIWLALLVPGILSGHPCAEPIAQRLEAWSATEEVLRAPSGPNGGEVYRIATTTRGAWIIIHFLRGLEQTSVFLSEPLGSTRHDYARDCSERMSRHVARAPGADTYTDAMLEEQLQTNDRLVVFLWSPHLPLSIDGYREAEAAARAMHVPFVALVDAGADESFVARAGDRSGIPKAARRRLGSNELLFRDLAVHTPSVLVFHRGRASAPLPGYRPRDAYIEHFRRIFGAESDSTAPRPEEARR